MVKCKLPEEFSEVSEVGGLVEVFLGEPLRASQGAEGAEVVEEPPGWSPPACLRIILVTTWDRLTNDKCVDVAVGGKDRRRH